MNDKDKTKDQLIKELQQVRKERDAWIEKHETCVKNTNQHTVENEFLRKLIDCNPMSIQILDKDGVSIKVNKAHTKLFKAIPPEGYNLFKESQLLEQGFGPKFELLKKGKTINLKNSYFNAHFVDKNFPDKLLYLDGFAFAIMGSDNTPENFVFIHKDITERIMLTKELEENNKNLRELYTNFQTKLEMQRKSIAADLHDNLIQDLAAHNMKLAKLKKMCNDPQVSEEMQEAITHVITMIRTSRNLLDMIWPTIIDNQGIQAAIAGHSERFAKRFHVEVITDIQPGMLIRNDISHPLFMIFQEAMTNIAKHARAGKVNISISQDKDHLHLAISDNGKGFDESKIWTKKTFGLLMIKDLVNSLGGSFTIKKEKKKGTLLDIVVPNNTIS